MPRTTRRRALLAAASGIAALAGCAGSSEHSASVPAPIENRIDDYEVHRVRNEAGTPLFHREDARSADDAEDDGDGNDDSDDADGDAGGDEPRYRGGRRVLVSADDVADLAFADVPEAEELRSFVAETDFETASVYLLSMPIEECYTVSLRSVSVETDELENGELHPHAQFCQSLRPADVECETDRIHAVGFAIRLPMAAERSTGSGRGMSGSCPSSPRGEPFDPELEPANGGDGE
ncbi:hypothetical protein SAMN04488066_10818 [Halorubrum aquaticum]|uniref:Uncharacterized protein n=1 Tax=Halorubrum aquaticum TaxID=387340 RepID=A0A1I3AXL3_9EURY|nr:hypothetical protein [Halorubrum aquaticum]SFH54764.1 hypothetical protein SAMN04488066_10818 [Halorubrum aquaticum]